MVTKRAGHGGTGASPLAPGATTCCPAWDELAADRRAKWGWQALHAWGHSRVPFSVDRLAETAGITPEAAADAVEIARQRKWVRRAGIAERTGARLYVGVLTARRR